MMKLATERVGGDDPLLVTWCEASLVRRVKMLNEVNDRKALFGVDERY